jgi:type IX secretion system PorP/SprF family membrane protein
MMKKLLLVIFLGMITGMSMAQDPEFSQFYAAPLYLNPAFAGSVRCPRITMNYRNQWPAILGQFTTYDVEYDQYVSSLSGGIGIMAWKDNAGSGTISTTNFSGIYSYQMNMSRDFTVNAGFQASYMQKNLDWSKLTFGDEIDPRYGFIYQTQEVAPKGTSSFLDLSAGLLGYTNEFYGGIAVAHLTQPNEGFISAQTPLPIKLTAHFGAMIPMDDSRRNTSYISPNILFVQQQDFQQINLGLYVSRGPLVGGLWYRFGDAIIALLGISTNGLKIGYSYDITVSKLSSATGGAHEISLSYQFECHPHKRRFRTINCPSF